MNKSLKSILVSGLLIAASSSHADDKIRITDGDILGCSTFQSVFQIWSGIEARVDPNELVKIVMQQGDCVSLYKGQKYIITQRDYRNKHMAEIIIISGEAAGVKMYIIDRGY